MEKDVNKYAKGYANMQKKEQKRLTVLCLSGSSFESPHLQIMKVWQRRLINDNNKKTSDDNNMKTIKTEMDRVLVFVD